MFLNLVRSQGKTFSWAGFTATCDPPLVREVLRSREHSLPRSLIYRVFAWLVPSSDGILFMADEDWKRRRSAVTYAFSGPHIGRFARIMHESAVETAEVLLREQRTASSAVVEPEDDVEARTGEAPLGRGVAHDLVSFTRVVALRFLMRWGFGLPVDIRHVGHLDLPSVSTTVIDGDASTPSGPPSSASASSSAATSSSSGPDPLVAPVDVRLEDLAITRRLARELDYFTKTVFDRVFQAEGLGGALREYPKLYFSAYRLRNLVSTVLDRHLDNAAAVGRWVPEHASDAPSSSSSSLSSSSSSSSSSALRPAPVNLVTALRQAGFTLAEMTSEVNHVQGAHKAIALVTACGLWELSRPENERWRVAVRAELDAVLGAWTGPGSGKGASSPAAGVRLYPDRDDVERMPVLRRVLEETLRCHVVSMGVMRKLGHDVEYEGKVLPKDSEVLVMLHALHYDPETWGADAHVFNPDRFLRNPKPDTYYPFLEGLRRCAGFYVARLQFAVYVNAFLRLYDLRADTTALPRLRKRPDMFTNIDGVIPFHLARRFDAGAADLLPQ